ncbi:MAG: beta-ketoacyl-ACP synthase II [Desulfobacterales bacterium]|nr:beta-ketoacyl-ACP synthase II [Desulfobacterales bacterium]MCP4162313.1 beta-ketoacyl-ACP synthase II [Deltaproteobacteria bacterium]
MKKRVVITGVGLVTPVGNNVEDSWDAICSGKSGVGPITSFDAKDHKTQIAAEVKGFDPSTVLNPKEQKRTHKFISYAIATADMAIKDAGLVIDENNAARVGVITGCGLGGLDMVENTTLLIEKRGPSRVSPFFIPMLIGNMAPGMISIKFGVKGPGSSVATACAASTHAIGDAYRTIQNGYADAMITGGTESVITPTCVAGFNALRALSTRNDDPEKASRPFDLDRDGFVVGEGSGMLILESLDHAKKRGAKIYAEIKGFGMNSDGYHMTAPSPGGEGAADCMEEAIKDAGVEKQNVDYINAHGTSTDLNDLSETKAIKTVFKDHAKKIKISSTKSMTGHLLGAAGSIEAVFTALSIKNGIAPGTINFENPGEGCDLDYTPNKSINMDINCALTNSFGFGGLNASLLLKKY